MRATGIVGAFLEGSPHRGGEALFAAICTVFQRKRPRIFPCAAVYLIKADPEQFIVLCAFTDYPDPAVYTAHGFDSLIG